MRLVCVPLRLFYRLCRAVPRNDPCNETSRLDLLPVAHTPPPPPSQRRRTLPLPPGPYGPPSRRVAPPHISCIPAISYPEGHAKPEPRAMCVMDLHQASLCPPPLLPLLLLPLLLLLLLLLFPFPEDFGVT